MLYHIIKRPFEAKQNDKMFLKFLFSRDFFLLNVLIERMSIRHTETMLLLLPNILFVARLMMYMINNHYQNKLTHSDVDRYTHPQELK